MTQLNDPIENIFPTFTYYSSQKHDILFYVHLT
jgi:hypothetical protein